MQTENAPTTYEYSTTTFLVHEYYNASKWLQLSRTTSTINDIREMYQAFTLAP